KLIAIRALPFNALLWKPGDRELLDKVIGDVLAASHPHWRLPFKRSARGRPAARGLKKKLRMTAREAKEWDIFLDVTDKQIEHLKRADPDDRRGFAAIVEPQRICHEVGQQRGL